MKKRIMALLTATFIAVVSTNGIAEELFEDGTDNVSVNEEEDYVLEEEWMTEIAEEVTATEVDGSLSLDAIGDELFEEGIEESDVKGSWDEPIISSIKVFIKKSGQSNATELTEDLGAIVNPGDMVYILAATTRTDIDSSYLFYEYESENEYYNMDSFESTFDEYMYGDNALKSYINLQNGQDFYCEAVKVSDEIPDGIYALYKDIWYTEDGDDTDLIKVDGKRLIVTHEEVPSGENDHEAPVFKSIVFDKDEWKYGETITGKIIFEEKTGIRNVMITLQAESYEDTIEYEDGAKETDIFTPEIYMRLGEFSGQNQFFARNGLVEIPFELNSLYYWQYENNPVYRVHTISATEIHMVGGVQNMFFYWGSNSNSFNELSEVEERLYDNKVSDTTEVKLLEEHNHIWTVEEEQPTHTQAWYYTEYCEICYTTKFHADIPATGHTYTWTELVPATTTTPSKLKGVCSCGDVVYKDGDVLKPDVPKPTSQVTPQPSAPTVVEQPATLKVTAKGLKKNKVTLKTGKTLKLKAVSNKPVIFKTNKKKVVAVSKTGKLKAKKKGKATITVTAGDKTIKIKVTVK